MKIPKHVMVAGRRIPIKVEPLDGCFGEYDDANRRILIDPGTADNPARLREILAHETIHCALALAGLSSESSGLLSAKQEEAVTVCFSTIAYPAIDAILNK